MNANQRTKKIMSQVLNVLESEITDESSQDSIKDWDSMSHMALVTSLEEEFSIVFSDTQVVEMLNFKLIIEILKEHDIH